MPASFSRNSKILGGPVNMQDSEVFYDLKHLLEESKMPVPPQLANHEAAKQKPGGFERKRDSVVFAKK
jgi:ATP-dependent RNA helicase DDX23/PRP28